MKTIGISFPIKETQEGGVFHGSKSTEQAIYSDMVALLTMRRGQRPMQSRMFSPIYDYIFDPLDSITQNELDKKIKEKIQEFIPQVEVRKIKFTPREEENMLNIKIMYIIIDFFEIEQTLTLEIPTQI